MASPCRGFDPNGPNAEATSYNTVFVDTSLDTHLVSIISSSDTVSDFKKKILLEHPESFPRIGGVKIHSVQVKRQGHFYHLPDSMLVRSAFEGFKKTWFLYVEVSCSEEDEKEQLSQKLDDGSENCSLLHLQNHSQGNNQIVPADDPLKLAIEMVPETVRAWPRDILAEISKDIEMEAGHLQDDCQKEFSNIDKSLVPPGVTLDRDIRGASLSKDDDSRDNNKTTMVGNLYELTSAVKKRKIEHDDNVEFTMKKKHKVESKKDPSVDAIEKVPSDIQERKIGGELDDILSSDANWMSIRKTSKSETDAEQSRKLEREEIGRDQSNSTTGEDVTKREKLPSRKVKVDSRFTGVGSRKEKNKKKKILSAPNDQVATSESNPLLSERVVQPNLNAEAPEENKKEGRVESVLNNDPKMMVSGKPLNEAETDGAEESIPSRKFLGTNSLTEAVDSVRTKKKTTRTKKKAPGSTGEGTKFTGAISSTVVDLFKDKTENDQSLLSLDESQKTNRVEKETVLSNYHDPQVQPSESVKPSDQVEAQEMNGRSILSHNLSLANEVAEASSPSTVKRKRGKAKKSTAGLQDKSDVNNMHETSLPAQDVVLEVEMNDETAKKDKSVPHIENGLKNDGELSSRHNPEVVLPEGNKPLYTGKVPMSDKESGFAGMSLDEVAEAGHSATTKRKKRKTKKSASELQDKSDVDNLNEASLPAQEVVLDVEMKDETPEKTKTVPHIEDKLENDGGLSTRYKSEVVLPEGNEHLDSGKVPMNVKESGFADMSLGEVAEAGNSATIKRKKKKAKKCASVLQGNSDVDNLNEEVVLGVEMNDETLEKNKTVPHIENKLENDGELSTRYKSEVDLGKVTVNDKESGFAEISLDGRDGLEAGKSGRSYKKKKLKRPLTSNDDSYTMERSNTVNPSPAEHFEGDMSILKHEPNMISSKANKTLDFGEATVNLSETAFATQSLDNEDGAEAGKSRGSEKRKRAKKCPDSVCDAHDKHVASEAQGNQSISSHIEEKQTARKEARDASISCSSKGEKIVSPLAEADQTGETTEDLNDNLREAKNDHRMNISALQGQSVKLQANEVQHLLRDEAEKEQGNAENIKKKVKKTRRKQNDVANTQSNSKIKGQNISTEEFAVVGDKMADEDRPSDTMNPNASATQTGTSNRSEVSELMLKKNAGVESKSLNPEEALKGGDSSDVPSHHARENNVAGTSIENIVETSKAADEGVNFRQYFVPEQHKNENASANKVKKALHSTEAKRKTKKPNFISDGTLESNLQRPDMSDTKGNQLEESSADAKGNQDMPGANREIPRASGNVVKTSLSHDFDKEKTPQKATKLATSNGFGTSRNNHSWLEKNNESTSGSSFSSVAKVSKRALQDTANKKQQSGFKNGSTSTRKFSSKNDGDIVNSLQQKSLLSAPGALFSDNSSESSRDENQFGNSDASTRTPSDNSSSSGYSDGESELSQGSRGNGTENAITDDGGCKSTLSSKFPDPKDMSLDMILRSSKRFKKAKFTASQDPDTESQPIEFVPDSQAN